MTLSAIAAAVAIASPIGTSMADDSAPSTTSEVAPTTSEVAPTTSEVAPTTSEVAPTTSEVAPTTSEVAPTTSEVAPTTSDVAPTTSALATSAPPPVADLASSGPLSPALGSASAGGVGARPTAAAAVPAAAVPAAAGPTVRPSAGGTETRVPAITPAGGLDVPRAAPARPGSIDLGPAQRPEQIPNVFTVAAEVSRWKILLAIAAMSGLGTAVLVHLGRRDQAAMDAIHLDLLLGLDGRVTTERDG